MAAFAAVLFFRVGKYFWPVSTGGYRQALTGDCLGLACRSAKA